MNNDEILDSFGIRKDNPDYAIHNRALNKARNDQSKKFNYNLYVLVLMLVFVYVGYLWGNYSISYTINRAYIQHLAAECPLLNSTHGFNGTYTIQPIGN